MDIEKFTLGMGDRFACQGRARLQAILQARERGLNALAVNEGVIARNVTHNLFAHHLIPIFD